MLGVELGNWHRRIGGRGIVRGLVLGPQFELAFLAFGRCGQAIDRKTQVGQNLVIDDVIKKYGVRVEGVLRQNDAILKGLVLADGPAPGVAVTGTLLMARSKLCEATHKTRDLGHFL